MQTQDKGQPNAGNIELPENICILLNVIAIVCIIWGIVDLIRGHVHQYATTNLNNAMGIVWVVIGIVVVCNSFAINRMIEWIQARMRNVDHHSE